MREKSGFAAIVLAAEPPPTRAQAEVLQLPARRQWTVRDAAHCEPSECRPMSVPRAWRVDAHLPYLRSFAVKTTLRALTEIRLRRSDEVFQGLEPDGGCDHLWIPDNRVNRERLVRAVELGNRLHGPATHWI